MNSSLLEQRHAADIFWGELSACDHCLQIYEDDGIFLDALEGFVAGGIRQGDAIILIATAVHLRGLEARLERNGFNVCAAIRSGQYIVLDARDTLSKFMIGGWPDEALFSSLVSDIIRRARTNHRKVRAFGEMVALMWAEGHCGATVRLEHLWNRLCAEQAFSLFCAYPKTGFTQDSSHSLADVCAAHSKHYNL